MMKRLVPALRDERGTTIGELAIVALLTGLVGAMIMTSLSTTVRAGSLVQEKTGSLQDVRTAIEVIERDLRAAKPIDAIDSSLPIAQYATKLQFSVYCANDGVGTCNDDNLRSVTYQLVDNELQRIEGGVTQVLVGPDGPEGFAPADQRGAVVNAATEPIFRYFDKRGTELLTSGAVTPPSSQFRDCVRHVQLHLVVVSAAGDDPETIDLKTSGTLRNFNEVDGCVAP